MSTESQGLKSQTTISAELNGQRLDKVISEILGCSRKTAADMIKDKKVLLNGSEPSKPSEAVKTSDELLMFLPPPQANIQPESDIDFEVIYEDSHLAVVNKPAGMVVHPGAGNKTGTLAAGILARYPETSEVGEPDRPGIVHRLDKETSGILVVARTSEAYDSLTAQIREKSAVRKYRAVCWGVIDDSEGIIEAPLGRSAVQSNKMAVVASGKSARTHYKVLNRFVNSSELSCRLETGRTHQIRVHLSAIGHPLVGDSTYNGARASLPKNRIALHSEHLSFVHPEDKKLKEFSSPLPKDISDLIKELKEAKIGK